VPIFYRYPTPYIEGIGQAIPSGITYSKLDPAKTIEINTEYIPPNHIRNTLRNVKAFSLDIERTMRDVGLRGDAIRNMINAIGLTVDHFNFT